MLEAGYYLNDYLAFYTFLPVRVHDKLRRQGEDYEIQTVTPFTFANQRLYFKSVARRLIGKLSVVEFENPVVTVLRLIESRIRVVKDDGGLANIKCSQANYDRELLKDIDAQITVSKTTDPCLTQKHTLDGKLRRRIYSLRATHNNGQACPRFRRWQSHAQKSP